MNKREFKRFRELNHWMYWVGENASSIITEDTKNAFLRFQSMGRKSLSDDECENIQPLIWAQKTKEISINSMIEECMEFWANGHGALIPIMATLETNKTDDRKLDRKSLKTFIKIYRQIKKSPYDFFMSCSGISEESKMRCLKLIINNREK